MSEWSRPVLLAHKSLTEPSEDSGEVLPIELFVTVRTEGGCNVRIVFSQCHGHMVTAVLTAATLCLSVPACPAVSHRDGERAA